MRLFFDCGGLLDTVVGVPPLLGVLIDNKSESIACCLVLSCCVVSVDCRHRHQLVSSIRIPISILHLLGLSYDPF